MLAFKLVQRSLPRWMAWVREQPCVVTGAPCEQVHHIIGHGRHSQHKRPDLFVLPLTADEHRLLHEDVSGWERSWGRSQPELWFWLFERAIREGVIKYD